MKQRYKTKAELESKVIRVSLADYFLLAEISKGSGVTMAEALHLALEHQEAVTRVSSAQIPMPVFRVAPVAAFRVAPSVTSIAVNGAGIEHSVFRIKPKGVRYA